MNITKVKAPRNRSITLSDDDRSVYVERLTQLDRPAQLDDIVGRTINQDINVAANFLPSECVDLLIVDPPYNLNKNFNGAQFVRKSLDEYESYLDNFISALLPTLKPTASIYVCGDWQSSTAIHRVLQNYFFVRNRITWEREKGRGAKANWKNCSEDVWFCTVSANYTFNVDAVMMKRKVVAPYKDSMGLPKDWLNTEGGKFRITHPANLWNDISIPFWSMPENTDHPTQKPEKLIAKLILASSNEGDIVFDPFLGSGTTSVVAKKLNRRYFGVEMDEYYCCLAEKRLSLVSAGDSIQGYSGGYFWERNTLADQMRVNGNHKRSTDTARQRTLFDGASL